MKFDVRNYDGYEEIDIFPIKIPKKLRKIKTSEDEKIPLELYGL